MNRLGPTVVLILFAAMCVTLGFQLKRLDASFDRMDAALLRLEQAVRGRQ